MLLNVLFVTVLVGPPLPGPSALLQQSTVVAPVSVTFEKLFRLSRMVDPFGDEAPPALVKKVTVPPAPFVNPVTIELLLTDRLPVAVMLLVPRFRKVTEPVVFTFRFVKVLLLTFVATEVPFCQLMYM